MAIFATGPVGELLREWRSVRRMSQLQLALNAGVSARHISFVETGRSRPSRSMVLRLSETLDLPLRERNALLAAAGFAPLYNETRLDGEAMRPVRSAITMLLRRHEPYPAFVLNRYWEILLANDAHRKILETLLPDDMDTVDPVNVLRLVLHPDLLRSRIENWDTVAHVLMHRVRRQLQVPDPDGELRTLYAELSEYPDVGKAMRSIQPPAESSIMIPMVFLLDGARISFFSTIATIGTPQDVTLEELRIESLFPADEESERAVLALMAMRTPGDNAS
jgi:transcriptional regulator with XRE-family HTH domain